MRNKIAVFDDCRRGNEIWFSNLSFNGLMRMDLNTGEVKVTGKFPGYGMEERNLHRRVFSYQNKLYFIPWFGKTIDIYDISADEFQAIEMPGMDCAVMDAARVCDEIWIFAASDQYPAYVLDLENGNLTPRTWVFDSIRKHVKDISLAISSVACRGDRIWLGIYDKNFLYQIDVKKRTVQEIGLPSDVRIKSVDIWGGNLWITDALHPELILIKDGKREIYYSEKIMRRDSFSRVIESGKYKMVLPHYASYMLFSDSENRRPEKVELPSWSNRCRMGALLFAAEVVGDVCMFLPFSLDGILCFDMQKKLWFRKEYRIRGISDDEIQEMLRINIGRQKCTGEMGEGIGWEDTLPIFMEEIAKHVKTRVDRSDINIGNRIYRDVFR
ncbi:MAG: hypothetical protein HFI93_08110 [Lachnospiraceae bacterium]|nr:hypothetical protein [Lachnospiraceae bacterium]